MIKTYFKASSRQLPTEPTGKHENLSAWAFISFSFHKYYSLTISTVILSNNLIFVMVYKGEGRHNPRQGHSQYMMSAIKSILLTYKPINTTIKCQDTFGSLVTGATLDPLKTGYSLPYLSTFLKFFTYLYCAIGKFAWLWHSLRSLVNFSFCLKSKYNSNISRNSDNCCWDKWQPGGNWDTNCSRLALREMLTRWDLSYTKSKSSELGLAFVSVTIKCQYHLLFNQITPKAHKIKREICKKYQYLQTVIDGNFSDIALPNSDQFLWIWVKNMLQWLSCYRLQL